MPEACESCLLKEILEKEIERVRQLQEEYLEKIKKVNETLAKYTKKLDELDNKKG